MVYMINVAIGHGYVKQPAGILNHTFGYTLRTPFSSNLCKSNQDFEGGFDWNHHQI